MAVFIVHLLLLLLSTQPLGFLHEVHWDKGDLFFTTEPIRQHYLLLHVNVRVGTAEGTMDKKRQP